MSTPTPTPAPEPTEAQIAVAEEMARSMPCRYDVFGEPTQYRTRTPIEAARLIAASEHAATEKLTRDLAEARGLVRHFEFQMDVRIKDAADLRAQLAAATARAELAECEEAHQRSRYVCASDINSHAHIRLTEAGQPDHEGENESYRFVEIAERIDRLRARAEKAERESERQRQRGDGCEGAFNTMANCQDTLRARDFCDGALDERVIAMAKALDAAKEDARRWQRVAGERYERLSLIGREMSQYMRDFWPRHREAVAALNATPQSYIVKPKCLEAIEQICSNALAATASEQPAQVHPDSARLMFLWSLMSDPHGYGFTARYDNTHDFATLATLGFPDVGIPPTINVEVEMNDLDGEDSEDLAGRTFRELIDAARATQAANPST